MDEMNPLCLIFHLLLVAPSATFGSQMQNFVISNTFQADPSNLLLLSSTQLILELVISLPF